MRVRTWHRALFGLLLLGAVATAGIVLNFTLLRLTQDAHDPVGRLSPRAVFADTTATTSTTPSPDDAPSGPTAPAGEDGKHESDD